MKILVVDDDKNLNKGICAFLESKNFEIDFAFNGLEGYEKIQRNHYDILLSDLQMPEMDGIELLTNSKRINNELPVMIMTAFASIENAVEAMKIGAEDYITKPLNLNELLIKINRVKSDIALKNENMELKKKLNKYELPEIIGTSEVINNLKSMLRRITNDSDIPILIYGQSGTGKELVARNIHFMSKRKNKPFIPINCAIISPELMESELFGHIKGSFTNAFKDKIGLLEEAEGGTLFFDEISEMDPSVQSKLLRFLQDGYYQPIGAVKQKSSNVRIICASNQRLADLVEVNKFRSDLYFRLNVIELEVPSLLARKDDMVLLISHFFEKYNSSHKRFSNNALNHLMKYSWPGNIRELENLIRMLIVTTSDEIIDIQDLPEKFKSVYENKTSNPSILENDFKTSLNKAIIDFEKEYLEYHLKKNQNNISKTADSINLSRVSLHKKLKEYSIG